MPKHRALHWDIFCKVIDNFGDIGTCWRLAHILHHDHGQRVRLWVDALDALKALVPATQTTARQTLAGIDVCHWHPDTPPQILSSDTADVVIEAFGCDLPKPYLDAMTTAPRPVWINLEYMSCEDWVPGVHGQVSMLAKGLKKHFVVPGLLAQSGGLLRETDLLTQRDDFTHNRSQQYTWRAQWHIPEPEADSLTLSLFAYENPRLGELLNRLSQAPSPISAYLPASRLLNSLRSLLKRPELHAGDSLRLGSLHLHILPFLPQSEYDRLLWMCDINYVRGEESLSRAIWSGKPFIWQIYPTRDAAHHAKLNAFLHAYIHTPIAEHLRTLRALTHHWNDLPGASCPDEYAALPHLHQHQAWYTARMRQLAERADLARSLLDLVAIERASGYNAAPK